MTGQPLSNLKGETTRVGVEGENLSEVIGGTQMETTGDHRPEEKLTEKIEGVHTEEMGGILSADIGRILLEKSSLRLKKEENLLEAEGIEGTPGSPVALTEAVPMAAMAGEHHFEVFVIPLVKKTPEILVA